MLSAVSGSDSDWITFSLLNWLCGGFVPILRLHRTGSRGTSVWAVWAGLKTLLEPKHVETVVLQPVKVTVKPKVWRRSEPAQRQLCSFQEDCFGLCSHGSDTNLKNPFFCLHPSVSPPFYLAGALCICLVCLVNSTAWAVREFRILFLCMSHKLAWWKICKFSNLKGND